MFILVCYDIADRRRLRRVAREMENFGTRAQRSVFECYLDDDQVALLQRRLAKLLDIRSDRVRYYRLCGRDRASIAIDGYGAVSQDWIYRVI